MKKLFPFLCLILAALCWGANFVVSMVGVQVVIAHGNLAHILAIIFPHEKLYTYHFVGVVFVSLGIILSSRSGARVALVSAENETR